MILHHAIIYILINTGLFVINHQPCHEQPLVVLLPSHILVIGLAAHTAKMLRIGSLFGRGWEKQKAK